MNRPSSHFSNTPKLLFIFHLVSLIAAGCQPYQSLPSGSPFPGQDWRSGNLRAIQDPGNIPTDFAFVAAYTRWKNTQVQIRLDFLASKTIRDNDLYIALNTQPGGGGSLPLSVQSPLPWDMLLILPANGAWGVIRPDGSPVLNVFPRVIRDPVQSDAVITLDRSGFLGNSNHFQIEAYSTHPDSGQVVGSIGPLWSDALPPAPAPVLLAFWNTLPAATPAQILRRWDGAHTGPLGQRHGLKEIIHAATDSGVPLALLDLKKPDALLGLNYLGELLQIRSLEAVGQLILPDTSWGDPHTMVGLSLSRASAQQAGLKASPFLYGALLAPPPSGYPYIFARLDDPVHLVRYQDRTLIPLPSNPNTQIDPEHLENGLTLAVRRQILAVALSPDPSDLLILGGSLPESAWGDAKIAGTAMAFLANHPWIRMLDAAGLESLPASQTAGLTPCADWLCLDPPADTHPTLNPTAAQIQSTLRGELEQMPASDPLRDVAWDSYLRLTDPDPDPARMALKLGYLGQIQAFIAADSWASHPIALASCTSPTVLGALPGCILANEHIFLVLAPDDGRVSFAFARTQAGLVQWIGPASEMVVGLSDPSTWKPGSGALADPQEIPGAFADPPEPSNPFQAAVQPDGITFTRAHGDIQKSYHLDGSSLTVKIKTSAPHETVIPILLPAVQDGRPVDYNQYFLGETKNGWIWSLRPSPHLEVSTNVPSERGSIHTFLDSYIDMRRPEDPDLGYPPGHYLPFPLAVLNLQTTGSAQISLSIR